MNTNGFLALICVVSFGCVVIFDWSVKSSHANQNTKENLSCSWEPHDEEVINDIQLDCETGTCVVCSSADNVVNCKTFSRMDCE